MAAIVAGKEKVGVDPIHKAAHFGPVSSTREDAGRWPLDHQPERAT